MVSKLSLSSETLVILFRLGEQEFINFVIRKTVRLFLHVSKSFYDEVGDKLVEMSISPPVVF